MEILETSSNARSAELAAKDKSAAAVTGILAAEKYELQILEQDIQDNAANATRFLVLGRQCSPPTGDDRTSLMVSVSDKVGALHEAIAAFRRFKINMTKIESRPSKRKAWEYFFFIDCDGHAQDEKSCRRNQNSRQALQFRKNPRLVSEHRLNMNHLAKAREVFDVEIAALKKVRAQLDKSFDAAVETIIAALTQRGKIVIVGIGKSGNVGQKIAATLTSTGSTSVVLSSVDALHGDVGIINDGDVILALSYSGESEELLNLLPALKRFSVKIISFTGNLKSSLAKHSDVSLNVKVPKEACPFNLAPTSSTTAMLVMGDALGDGCFAGARFQAKRFCEISSEWRDWPRDAFARRRHYAHRKSQCDCK